MKANGNAFFINSQTLLRKHKTMLYPCVVLEVLMNFNVKLN